MTVHIRSVHLSSWKHCKNAPTRHKVSPCKRSICGCRCADSQAWRFLAYRSGGAECRSPLRRSSPDPPANGVRSVSPRSPHRPNPTPLDARRLPRHYCRSPPKTPRRRGDTDAAVRSSVRQSRRVQASRRRSKRHEKMRDRGEPASNPTAMKVQSTTTDQLNQQLSSRHECKSPHQAFVRRCPLIVTVPIREAIRSWCPRDEEMQIGEGTAQPPHVRPPGNVR